MRLHGSVWRRASAATGALALALTLGGCPGLLPGTSTPEGIVTERDGTVRLNVGGAPIRLRAPEGRSLEAATVLVAGKLIPLGANGLQLPSAVAQQARLNGLLVLVPGYMPVRVKPGISAQELVLVPTTPVAATTMPSVGGSLADAAGALKVTVPPGMLLKPGTRATLATYQPPAGGGNAPLPEERTKLATLAGHGSDGTLCDKPLPCPPVSLALGLYLQLEGPLRSGSLGFAIDLAALLRSWDGHGPPPWEQGAPGWSPAERARALAAARILATFAAMDATGDSKWRETLRDRYHLRLEGQTLHAVVSLGGQVDRDGYLQVDVAGTALLGVHVEITVMSQIQTDAPPIPAPQGGTTLVLPGTPPISGGQPLDPDDPPPPVIGAGSGSGATGLISPGGAGGVWDVGAAIIANNSGGIITDNGTGIIANNGGGISGELRVPLLPELAKLRLLNYVDYAWPEVAVVQAADLMGTGLTPFVSTDSQSRFNVTGLPPTPKVLFLESRANVYRLRAMAAAPGTGSSTADVNAATTAVASLAAEEVVGNSGSIQDLDFRGYPADVAKAFALMDQPAAIQAVSGTRPQAAAQLMALFNVAGYAAASIPSADVTTIAGAAGVAALASGPGAAARFNNPTGIDFFPNGDMVLADRDNNRIVRIAGTAPYTVSLLAGDGTAGLADGVGAAARFRLPRGVRVAGGKVYVADGNNGAIRVIAADGTVTTLAGGNGVGRTDGPGNVAQFDRPIDTVTDPAGNVYVVEYNNRTIRKVTPGGVVSTFAGSGAQGLAEGAGTAAIFHTPYGICMDPAGNLYVADTGNHRIRKITPGGVVSTLTGSTPNFVNGTLADARFNSPSGMCIDAAGTNLYVTEVYNNRVRKIDLAAGYVTTIAGTGVRGYGDGKGLRSRFFAPRGISVGPGGVIAIVDRDNQVIRFAR